MIEMALTAAGIAMLPVGYLIKRQLDYNKLTLENAHDIASIKDDTEHTRSRVDALYDHLIASERP